MLTIVPAMEEGFVHQIVILLITSNCKKVANVPLPPPLTTLNFTRCMGNVISVALRAKSYDVGAESTSLTTMNFTGWGM